jgi:hypothetical protein
MSLHRFLMLVAFVFGCIVFVPGQPSTPSPSMEVTGVAVYSSRKQWCTVTAGKECQAGIGDRLIVYVEGLPAQVNKEKDPINPRDLVLYLDQRELSDLKAVPYGDHQLAFDLRRTDASSQAWNALLAKPGLKNVTEKTRVSVGFPGKQALPATDQARITLRLYYSGWAIAAVIGLLLTLGLFVWLAKTTGIIRDAGPPLLTATKRPFSLARTQAAFWFFLVIGSFLFLYLITGDYNTITDQALILIGIGTGTALGAAMIDASKKDTANDSLAQLNPERARLEAELKELANQHDALRKRVEEAGDNATPEDRQALSELNVQQNEKKAKLDEIVKKINDASTGLAQPASEGFRKDLLTDSNGINFHRFQMVIWTIVLGVLFCVGVYSTLAMPAFSGTLLALMGISSGTYLGFKIPERQT